MYKAILVDDEPQIRKGLSLLIPWDEYGIELSGQAENGEDALELIRRVQPDIAIIDIRMPGMDGLDLLRALDPKARKPKCIMLSGFDRFDYVRTAMRLGAVNYLLKPVDAEELKLTIRETLNTLDDEADRKQQFDESLQILYNNIMNRVIRGQIDVRELQEKCALLDISLRCNHMLTAILRPVFDNADVTLRHIMFESLDVCRSSADLNACAYAFADDRDNIVLIIKDAEHRLDDAALDRMLSEAASAITNSVGVACIYAIGGEAASYKGLPEAYRLCARRITHRLLWNGCDIDPDELTALPGGLLPTAEELALIFKRDDRQAWGDLVREFFRQSYRTSLDDTPEALRLRVIEFCTRVLHSAGKCCLPEGEVFGIQSQLYRTVQEAATVQEMEAIALRLLNEINSRSSGPDISNCSHKVQFVIRHIRDHYGDCDLSLKTLAAQLDVNPAYLGRQFSIETGEFFSDFLNRTRIRHAQQLLSTTTLRVSDIANQVGFLNVSYFSTLYKKMTGETPAQSRSPEQEAH